LYLVCNDLAVRSEPWKSGMRTLDQGASARIG
jgi:hypothetical protein